MKCGEKVQALLLGAGLLLAVAGVEFELGPLVPAGAILLGAGVAAGGYFRLVAARTPPADPQWEPSVSQKAVALIHAILEVGAGVAVSLGALAAALLGADHFWRLLIGQPGPLLLAIGAVLVGLSIEVVLGEGQAMSSRWEMLASLPLRVASLPLMALGLACLALGFFALLLPAQFRAWIAATFGPFLPNP